MKLPIFNAGVPELISNNVSPQECVNFYYEKAPEGESHDGALLPVHGSTSILILPNSGGIRNIVYNPIDENLYVVADNDFYEINTGLTVTDRGDLLSSGAWRISSAFNPATQEIMIVDENYGYTFDCVTNTFAQITDTDYTTNAGSDTVAFLDGYFIVNDNTPGRFRWSNLNDGTAWDAADFATAESIGSDILAIVADRGVLWIMGEHATELWYNSGDATTPFVRFERIPHGVTGNLAVTKFDNTLAWASASETGTCNIVRAGQGYLPEVISTPQISKQLQEFKEDTNFDNLISLSLESYIWEGREFLVVSLLNTNYPSWVYDARTRLWHQRTNSLPTKAPWPYQCIKYWRARGHLVAGNAYPAGNGNIYQFNIDDYTNNGTNIPRRVTGPLIFTENEARLRFSEVQVDIEEGVNTGSETGDDGQLTLSYSKDGGNNYTTGVQLDLGTSRTHRLIKRKLGAGRLWNFRIYTDTPNKIVIKGAYGRTYSEPLSGYTRTK